MYRSILPLCVALMATIASLAAGEPTVSINGWTNIPGVREGTINTRPVNTTLPVPPLGYVDYLPLGYDPANTTVRWPVVIYLAGVGEAGDGTNTAANANQLYVKMTKHGPLYQARQFNWDFPAVIIAPQAAANWNSTASIKRVVDYALANYRVDPTRVTMTGLCDGASGTLRFAATYPNDLAAILPIEVSFNPTASQASSIKDLPMWIAHCFADTSISRNCSITWNDMTTAADRGAASDCMATYPGFGGSRTRFSTDTDAAGRPLDPNGPTFGIANCTATNGSRTVTFPSTMGSSTTSMWNGSAAKPFALAKISGTTYVVAGSSVTALTLVDPFIGPSGTHPVTMQLPVGYTNTAYLNTTGTTWNWVRDQPWDANRPSKRIFTMFWFQNHGLGWVSTWANGQCWDWLFSQVRSTAPVAPSISAQPLNATVAAGLGASFSVTCAGTPPLTFTWMRNGVPVTTSATTTYTTPPTTLSDSGSTYSVQISNAQGSVLSSSATLTVTPLAIALTENSNYQVFQRTIGGTSRPITFSGTCSSAQSFIQVRVVGFTSAAEVVPWTTVASAHPGGAFSGTVTVPQGGWYRSEVRATNASLAPLALASTANRWGVGVNVLCIGQSNMYGWGSTTFTAADDRVGLLRPGSSTWQKLVDPWLVNGKASLGPELGNTLVAGLGVPIGLVPSASLGSGMIGSDGTAWSYRNAANHFDAATLYGSALGRAQAAGGVEFIALSQGATDAAATTPPSASAYVAAVNQLKSYFAEDLPNGAQVRWVFSQVGRKLDGVNMDAGYNAVREAQRLLDNGGDMLLAGATLDFAIADSVSHYDQAGQDAHGRRLGRAILRHLGLRQHHGGPRIASLSFADAARSQIRVAIEHRGGSDITPATGIPGFVVSDSAGIKTISAARSGPGSIDLLCTTPCVGTTTVTYLAGKNPAGPSGLVHDNQADPEMLLPITVPAAVTEAALPVITQQPQPTSVVLGVTASFTVQATSSNPPLAYQWRRNSADIPGATQSQLRLTTTSADQDASISVRVSDAQGYVDSLPVQLTLISLPEATDFFQRVTAAGGTLDDNETLAVIQLIQTLKDAGIWAKLRRFNVLIGDATAAKVPLIALGGSAVDTWNGGLAYDRSLGAICDGLTGFIAIGARPADLFTNGANLEYGAFVTVGGAGGTSRSLLGGGTSTNRHSLRYVKGNVIAMLGGNSDCVAQTGGLYTSVPDGHLSLSITGANQANAYLSAREVASDTSFTVAAFQNQLITVGAYHSFGTVSEHANVTIAAYHFGSGLTSAENTQLYQSLQRFMQRVDREQRVAAWGDSMTALGSSSWLAGLMSGTFPYRTSFNGGVGGQNSSQILSRFDSAPLLHGWNTVIWAGRNDLNTVSADVPALLARIANMVNSLGHDRYRIVEILPKEDPLEYTGGSRRALIDTANNSLASTYGARFVRLLPYLQAAANGSATDALDVTRGIVPRSLRVDSTHLTIGPVSGNAIVLERIRQSVLPGWANPLPSGGG